MSLEKTVLLQFVLRQGPRFLVCFRDARYQAG
jgi:hypothetical protein